jgi:hypothetical protein
MTTEVIFRFTRKVKGPTYSPDLGPFEFHVLTNFKKFLWQSSKKCRLWNMKPENVLKIILYLEETASIRGTFPDSALLSEIFVL